MAMPVVLARLYHLAITLSISGNLQLHQTIYLCDSSIP